MENPLISKLCFQKNIQLTALRKDVLSLLLAKSKPMGAYEILKKLKKKRPNAQPPTVYRVLEFLIEKGLVHRIESQNTYVCCSALSGGERHRTLLLLCKICYNSYEFSDEGIFLSLQKFAKKNSLKINDALIEMQGFCPSCVAKKKPLHSI